MKEKIGKIIRIILWIFVIVASVCLAYGIYRESRIRDYEEGNLIQLPENNIEVPSTNEIDQNAVNEVQNNVTNENTQTSTPTPTPTKKPTNNEEELPAGIPATYKGYTVSARLKISKINVDTYVLKNYSKAAVDICVTKYYGPDPNEVGNYCIAGHNFLRKNMFGRLNELRKGDKFTLTDKKHGEVTYEIYDIYKVKPEQTEVLSQNTNGKKEVTLITCSDYTSKRIIVKAREKV